MRNRILLALALGPALAAQGYVSPAHFTVAEGNYYGALPLGSTTTPDRYLQVHDDFAGTARSIGALAFRRDGGNPYEYQAYSMLVDVLVSTAATSSDLISATFDNNHGANKTTVGQFKLVQFPVTHHTSERAFDYRIPFDRPFAFNGAGPFCWEIKVSSRTNASNFYFDAFYLANPNPYPYDWTWGTGCKATGETYPMSMSGGSYANWSGGSVTLRYTGYYFPANALITLLIGAQDKNFGGIPLPYELPGTNGFPSGKCFLYLDPLLTVPQLTNAQGQLNANLGVGVNTSNNGNFLFVQAVAIDTQANAFGLVLGNMVQTQVLAPFTNLPISQVYLQGGIGAVGTLSKNIGYVIKVD